MTKVNFSSFGANISPEPPDRTLYKAHRIPESNTTEIADAKVHPAGEGNGGTKGKTV